MADFGRAYEKTMKHEASKVAAYSKNPRDVGGETYKGISRVFHPEWEGWKIIDHAKGKHGAAFVDHLKDYDELQACIPIFYKLYYWDVFLGDLLDPSYQKIAEELFDTGVNMGVQRAVLFLQKSLNAIGLRKSVTTTTPLIEDGVFGNKTYTALTKINPKHVPTLYKMMNIMQGNHYLRYIEKDYRQAEFLVGWLKRVEIAKV
jgi:lysozyme family protein